MEIIDKMEPVVIFALLSICLAVLNFLLWIMVWKKSATDKSKEDIATAIMEMKNKIDAGTNRNLKLEDQLWGILDRFKEQEQILNQINKNISSQGLSNPPPPSIPPHTPLIKGGREDFKGESKGGFTDEKKENDEAYGISDEDIDNLTNGPG